MRHSARLYLLFLALAGCAAAGGQPFRHGIAGDAKPWLHENFDAAEEKFTFAIISDLTGQERDGVFEVAVEQLNLLRPEFIISVGDIIDGAAEDEPGLHGEWDTFSERGSKARAPLFLVGGNHDLVSQAQRNVWSARYGPYHYHFVYNNALFLVLDTEDYPPTYNPEVAEDHIGEIGDEQAARFERVIADNPNVRWTFLFAHKPIWRREDENAFKRIERALSDRSYTLFNGHYHDYLHTLHNDRDHIQLGTTGGGQRATRNAAFDHVMLVTVDEGEPSIATLRMDGVFDKSGKIPANGEEMCFEASRCGAN